MNKQQIIERVLAHVRVAGRRYHSPLPAELAEWYCYTVDGGHSILCLLERDAGEAAASHNLTDHLVPCPVRAVLRAGYRIQRGYVVVDLPSDQELGLLTEAGDDEY